MQTQKDTKDTKDTKKNIKEDIINTLLTNIESVSNKLTKNYLESQYKKYLSNTSTSHTSPLTSWIFDIKKPETQQILFYDVLKLKPIKDRGRSGRYSTNTEFQEAYVSVPEVKHLDEINKLDKTFSTNIKDVYEKVSHREIREEQGRVRAKIAKGKKLTKGDLVALRASVEGDEKIRLNRVNSDYGFLDVVTGRSSSRNPNFQNISVRSLYSKLIKRQFISPKGYLSIHSDFNAAEVRALANLAQDENLRERFVLGMKLRRQLMFETDEAKIEEIKKRIADEGDIHKYHYRVFHGLPLDAPVTKEQRQSVKGLVFGLVYGRSPQSFAQSIGSTVEEAQHLFDKFFEFYPKSKKFLFGKIDQARNKLYVKSPLGRYRRLGASLSCDVMKANQALSTQSRNSSVQGFSSDTVYIGHSLFFNLIYKLNTKYAEYGWNMDCSINNTVHDSLEGECKIEHLPICFYMQSIVYSNFVCKYFKKHFNFEMILPQELDMELGTNMSDFEGLQWKDLPDQVHRLLISQSNLYDKQKHEEEVNNAIEQNLKAFPNITPDIVREVTRVANTPINHPYTQEEIDEIMRKFRINYEIIDTLWKEESKIFMKDLTFDTFLSDVNKIKEVGSKLAF